MRGTDHFSEVLHIQGATLPYLLDIGTCDGPVFVPLDVAFEHTDSYTHQLDLS